MLNTSNLFFRNTFKQDETTEASTVNINQTEPSNLMEVHLVAKDDIFYKKGRILACEVYNKVWNTEKLIDGNDYGIVVSHQGKVVGNLNIQLRHQDNILKSEVIFGREHWNSYFDINSENAVELSGFAIAKDINPDIRQSVMMLLIFGTYTVTRALGKEFWVTIQRKTLHRLLTKRLHLPFCSNEIISDIQGKVPQDDYWSGNEIPQIHYLNISATETVNTLNSFFFYLNTIGVEMKFLSRFQQKDTNFSSFYKNSKVAS